MSKLSYGLNITKKPPSLATRPLPAKRKIILDDESGPDDSSNDDATAESISTIGGIASSFPQSTHPKARKPPGKPTKPLQKFSQYGDLSTHHSSSLHAKTAQIVDPSIYDYDSVYDSLHAKPPASSSSFAGAAGAAAAADTEKRPKYMGDLLAAAETRKRDQLRAKEKMLAKDREAEGDEFADKEKFVTGAYKRQQEEMRRLEAEEAAREQEAEERKRREGGGLKSLYKNMLERDDQKHMAALKAAKEAKSRAPVVIGGGEQTEVKKEKSEADLAREKGAIINEDGQVIDKRQLLNAGLNAVFAPAPRPPSSSRAKGTSSELKPRRSHHHAGRSSGCEESARERETRMFEEQLLGKRGFGQSDDNDEGDERNKEVERAAKSRKLEDEILGSGR